MDHFGQLNILVYAAGTTLRRAAMLTSTENSRQLVAVNLEGVFSTTRACLRQMIKDHWGRIIILGSRAGRVGLPGESCYAATKGALMAWAASLAGEVGSRGITVNVLSPGALEGGETKYSDAEQEAVISKIGAGRLGTFEEVANVAVFLCSNRATYVNGAVIDVDGGARF